MVRTGTSGAGGSAVLPDTGGAPLLGTLLIASGLLVRRHPRLLEEFLEVVLEVLGGDRALGGVGDGILAEMVEGEGAGRGEPTAAGMLQDEPHQLQGDLCFALALLHTDDRLSEGLSGIILARFGRGVALW